MLTAVVVCSSRFSSTFIQTFRIIRNDPCKWKELEEEQRAGLTLVAFTWLQGTLCELHWRESNCMVLGKSTSKIHLSEDTHFDNSYIYIFLSLDILDLISAWLDSEDCDYLLRQTLQTKQPSLHLSRGEIISCLRKQMLVPWHFYCWDCLFRVVSQRCDLYPHTACFNRWRHVSLLAVLLTYLLICTRLA